MRFRTARPRSQRFSPAGLGTSVKYPPGEMHAASVPTQVGKYHSGSVKGSVSSRGGGVDGGGVLVGSQAHEKALEQRYKHVRGKKRQSYLQPREEVGGRHSSGEWGFEQRMAPIDFERYMQQQRGLERDFGTAYAFGGHSPSPPDSPAGGKPSRSCSPRSGGNHSSIPIPASAGSVSETDAGTGNTSLKDSVRFSDVQWSSVGSGGSATGTTATMESGTNGDSLKGKGPGAGAGKHKAAPGQRRLRRKRNFEERDGSSAATPASSRSQTTTSKEDELLGLEEKGKGIQKDSGEEVTTMEQLKMMRVAMWNGRLEKVVPPSKNVPKHSDVLQPSTPASTSTRNSGKSRNEGKGRLVEGRASPIQKLKGYMGHGVEVVDDFFERKTNLKTGGKLPSPFEYLLYPSYEGKEKGKGREERTTSESRAQAKSKGKGREDEGKDSDDELWGCVGEQNNESGLLATPPPKENRAVVKKAEPQQMRKESHTHWEDRCKLCRGHGSSGPRGLCRTCEDNFLNTKAWEDTAENFSDDSEIPPTPPPKDRHITSMREILATTPPNYRPDPSYRPPAQDPDSIHVSRVENSRPQLVNPSPVRQESQKLIYGGMGDSPRDIEIGFPGWQTHSLEVEGAKTEQMFKRWSDNYRVDDSKGGVSGNGEEGQEKERSPRDSSFYDFWGDVLVEDGRPETPTLEERKPKTG